MIKEIRDRIATSGHAVPTLGSAENCEHLGLASARCRCVERRRSGTQGKGDQITIKYEVFPPTEYDSKLLVSLQGGVGPDIMYTRRLPGARTQALIDNGYLTALNGLVDLSNFDSVSLSFISANNKVWGVPLQIKSSAFFTTKPYLINTSSKSHRHGTNLSR